MESIPFLHANKIFTITFEEDLAFVVVRSILDQLLARNAFDSEVQQYAEHFLLDCDKEVFKVWVVEMEVIVQREQLL
ncbi:MAG: hypothetical protein V1897_08060 [Pseudomonadota bacterium]